MIAEDLSLSSLRSVNDTIACKDIGTADAFLE